MKQQGMAGMAYRPEIDGLRALAVMAVVVFHLGLACPGGYVGVDVFFVISGFLITGIVRRGMDNDTFSLAEFWERRIRRIFPALFVVVIASLAAGYLLLLPHELEELGKSSIAQAAMLANVYFWRHTGYFAGPAESKPLLHTWSLAMEEQFYLLFPLALLFIRRLGDKTIFWILALVALVSFAGSVCCVQFHPETAFYMLPYRAWELLVGCLLALLPWQPRSSPRRDSVLASLGLLAIVLPVFYYGPQTPFPGLAAVPPVLGTAAILFATGSTRQLRLCQVLSRKPIVFIGLISYSFYLWHWPVIVFTRTFFGSFGPPEMFFAGLVSVCVAIVSWKFIETPFRNREFLKSRRRLFGIAGGLSGVTIALGAFMMQTDGTVYSKIPQELADDLKWNGSQYITHLPIDRPSRSDDFVTLGRTDTPNNQRIDFFVWGDSHGMALSEVLDELGKEFGLHGKSHLAESFIPLPHIQRQGQPENRVQIRERIMSFLDETRPTNLVLIARWSGYAGFEGVDVDKQPYQIFDPRFAGGKDELPTTIIDRSLTELVEFCQTRGIQLWIIEQIPESGESRPSSNIAKNLLRNMPLQDKRRSEAEHLQQQQKINHVFRGSAEVPYRLVDLSGYMVDGDGFYLNYFKGRALYRDQDHVTRWGAEKVSPGLRQTFREMSIAVASDSSSNTRQ